MVNVTSYDWSLSFSVDVGIYGWYLTEDFWCSPVVDPKTPFSSWLLKNNSWLYNDWDASICPYKDENTEASVVDSAENEFWPEVVNAGNGCDEIGTDVGRALHPSVRTEIKNTIKLSI